MSSNFEKMLINPALISEHNIIKKAYFFQKMIITCIKYSIFNLSTILIFNTELALNIFFIFYLPLYKTKLLYLKDLQIFTIMIIIRK